MKADCQCPEKKINTQKQCANFGQKCPIQSNEQLFYTKKREEKKKEKKKRKKEVKY